MPLSPSSRAVPFTSFCQLPKHCTMPGCWLPFSKPEEVTCLLLLTGGQKIKSWTIKKTENWRIDAFELWCWRRLLRVPWTARRSNQSILKEISPEYSLEGLRLKLKLQYLATCCAELSHWKRPWCWERLKAGGEGDDRGWDSWMASPTQWTWVWVNSVSWWWTGRPGVLQSMGSQRVGHYWVSELNWTELIPTTSQVPHKWEAPLNVFLIRTVPFTKFFTEKELPSVHKANSIYLSSKSEVKIVCLFIY